MYYLLTRVFPIPATSDSWNEVDIDTEETLVAYYGQEVVGDQERESLEFGLSSKRTTIESKTVQ